MASDPPAKFFVNQGLVTSRTDLQHLLRPILKQTVSYRYLRGRELVAHGTGWVERIVADQPDVSTYFTPIAITINVDSFEHLEFETRPDQLLVYTLVQGDERVVIEFVPTRHRRGRRARRAAPARVRHQRVRADGAPGPGGGRGVGERRRARGSFPRAWREPEPDIEGGAATPMSAETTAAPAPSSGSAIAQLLQVRRTRDEPSGPRPGPA